MAAKTKQPKVTRIYHVPGKGTVVEELYVSPGRRQVLSSSQKRKLEELKRQAGFYDPPAPPEPTRVVIRKPTKKAAGKPKKPTDGARRNGRKKAA